MVKALVTGGTGFVGSHVARALVEGGHQIRILHRASSKLNALEGLVYESALGDVTDEPALRAACEGCDWVFHVAAVADYWRADSSYMMQVNVEGTRYVLQAAQEAGVKRVIFTSSAAAVGMRADGKPADEGEPFNQSPSHFPYAYSKVLAEELVLEVVKKGQNVVTVNPVVVMGPGDLNKISGEFVLTIAKWGALVPVTSGGVAVTDVRDVARWHVAAAERGQSGQRYILGTENVAYPYWFDLIAETVGKAHPRLHVPSGLLPITADIVGLLRRLSVKVPVDSTQTRIAGKNIFFDFTRTWNELGEPQVNMKTSLRDTYEWYREHGFI
ncbi:MAG: NAD-dependent epimerase/dehydratase family protein [Anaerolineae bacterium]|nr:NAD-dependent epimerase/dehydratase family protein [Anaerolineae bacterium]